jgi:two-component system response regulator HydG
LRADVRVIASSKHNLATLVDNGLFRQDLYYALSAVSLRLPSLRQRCGDIETLAEHFRAAFAREIGKPIVGFTPEALEMLRRHPWPGNVLELENIVERAVIVNRGSWIEPCHLGLHHHQDGIKVRTVSVPVAAASRTPSAATILPLKEALEEPEKQLILQALESLNWNRQETARVLDINRTTLYKKMKKYELLFDEPIWAN